MAKFVVANKLSGGKDVKVRRQSADNVEALLSRHADVCSDNRPEGELTRRCYTVEAATADIAGIRAELGEDLLVEPEHARHPAVTRPPILEGLLRAQAAVPVATGMGEGYEITLRCGNQLVAGAKGTLVLASLTGRVPGASVEATSNDSGVLSFLYDPTQFKPTTIVVEPASGFWSMMGAAPASGSVMTMIALPKTGPIGWWHQVVGIQSSNLERGKGIRVGIADTGLGPNPYLNRIKALGAVVNGKLDTGPGATDDTMGHGTHVAGIVGAVPVEGSGDFEGIAAGAEIGLIRVFGADGSATQAEVALGIDLLAAEFQADLINLSLGGPEPSAIERDALTAALEMGGLCMAAAGNSSGKPVYYPAAYPEAVAVNALGLAGMAPAGAMDASFIPTLPVYWSQSGLFATTFDAVGVEVACSAPGLSIISTVPARPEVAAPYMEMSGTSMASPVTTAALATLLSGDATYAGLARGPERAQRAGQVLAASFRNLGITNYLAGYGLVTGRG